MTRPMRLAGLEPLTIADDSLFVNVGERTNVTGSRAFAKLVLAGDYAGAVEVARQQVQNGAQMIDVNMDEAMLDSKAAMVRFLHLIAGEPDIARVPMMIDSSKWSVIEAGLKCVQGKPVVNSISMKEGEAEFLRQAKLVRRYGAAAVVMAFDEKGQADTFERKVDICRRAYELLTQRVGFPPEDIIFDPNIFAIATGIEEHNNYAVDFINATRWIKQHLPHAKVSGGVSNVSFSFRGNDPVREAIHTVFLYHAIKAGLSMGIVNAGQLGVYDQIDPQLRERVEDVVLNRRADATERLVEFAETYKATGRKAEEEHAWRNGSVEERLSHALVMKQAVAHLVPFIEAEKAKSGDAGKPKGTIVMATVKGDVHDIGKNIVGVVLQCNNFDVIDLGVMVPAQKILDTARAKNADIVGLSGLITPSLEEMAHVAHEMQRLDMRQPLLIGGATTSRVHTAVKIAPNYPGVTVYVPDASRAVGVASNLMSDELRNAYVAEVAADYEKIRAQHAARKGPALLSLGAARANAFKTDWQSYMPPRPAFLGRREIRNADLSELSRLIDWAPFFQTWELSGPFPAILDDPVVGEVARNVYAEGQAMLKRIVEGRWLTASGVIAILPANSVGDDIELYADPSRTTVALTWRNLRQQNVRPPGKPNYCLADFVAPKDSGIEDYAGAFAVTAGLGIERKLAEFAAMIREEYRGIRPAPGYPACPDHTVKAALFGLLQAGRIGMQVTESYAMLPAASVSGFYLAHPEATYFAVGKIGEDQLSDFARRAGETDDALRRSLAPSLA